MSGGGASPLPLHTVLSRGYIRYFCMHLCGLCRRRELHPRASPHPPGDDFLVRRALKIPRAHLIRRSTRPQLPAAVAPGARGRVPPPRRGAAEGVLVPVVPVVVVVRRPAPVIPVTWPRVGPRRTSAFVWRLVAPSRRRATAEHGFQQRSRSGGR